SHGITQVVPGGPASLFALTHPGSKSLRSAGNAANPVPSFKPPPGKVGGLGTAANRLSFVFKSIAVTSLQAAGCPDDIPPELININFTRLTIEYGARDLGGPDKSTLKAAIKDWIKCDRKGGRP